MQMVRDKTEESRDPRSKTRCPVCSAKEGSRFFLLEAMPVSIGVQWPSREEATNCQRGDLDLQVCPRCGFIWNERFDAKLLEYSQRYDNSLDHSAVFREFADELAHRLVDAYGLRNKRVVEVGCGKGHFLALLCEKGPNTGVGFDPSYEGERIESDASDRISYYQDFYGEEYTSHQGDLVCCRHVFEHIEDPSSFLATIRRTIGENRETVVYFEVPNVRFILEKLSVWDVIYEHCNYFSRESLAHVFEQAGFEILRLEEAYGGQFLSLEAALKSPGEEGRGPVGDADLGQLLNLTRAFAKEVEDRSNAWDARMRDFATDGRSVVVWGAGAKTVSFLNMLTQSEVVKQVVDINPNKQGLFVPGSGQEIVPPEKLVAERPDAVVLMNPIYEREVRRKLDELGVQPEVLKA